MNFVGNINCSLRILPFEPGQSDIRWHKLRIEAFLTPAREYRINHQEIFETCKNLPVRNDSGEEKRNHFGRCITNHISVILIPSNEVLAKAHQQSMNALLQTLLLPLHLRSTQILHELWVCQVIYSWEILKKFSTKNCKKQRMLLQNESSGKISSWKNHQRFGGTMDQSSDNLWVWLAAWIYKKDVHVYSLRN